MSATLILSCAPNAHTCCNQQVLRVRALGYAVITYVKKQPTVVAPTRQFQISLIVATNRASIKTSELQIRNKMHTSRFKKTYATI